MVGDQRFLCDLSTVMKNLLCRFAVLAVFVYLTLQDCREEISNNGISVTWHHTTAANNVESNPLCYNNEQLVTRNCTDSTWIPPLDELQMCLKVVQYFDLTSCPPGFHRISERNNDYCYQIHESSTWDFPCLESGAASVITDLDSEEVESLFDSLNTTSSSKYFWLPAKRPMIFQPLIWYIPGSNWGRRVESINSLPILWNPFKNCLLLDIEQRALVPETCSKVYPSLCFYINDLQYPTKCPNGYHAFRFMSNDSTCLGIEKSENASGLNYVDFIKTKCSKPMGKSDYSYLKRFMFKKIAEMDKLPNDMWCWFTNLNDPKSLTTGSNNNLSNITVSDYLEAVINNIGTLSLINIDTQLPCMACETELVYEETEILLEYNDQENKIHLTVYFPSGLWKYDVDDKGIQCFSDAQGFIKVIEINDLPLIENENINAGHYSVEKIVYAIDLVTDMSAQYWCEGHMKNFSLIATEKIVVNPQGSHVHVFSLHISINVEHFRDPLDMAVIIENISNIFKAKKTLIMDISEHKLDEIKIVLHLHVAINQTCDNMGKKLQNTYTILYNTAEIELPKYNFTFINLASATICLPTTSYDYIALDWDVTPIGHFATPNQFCLQTNGLPVKRLCYGSYVKGSKWGDVEGNCYPYYKPSTTTTFLYKFVNGHYSQNTTTSFLTDGLTFVLHDTDIMIPADIYYLSMSLNYISNVAQINQTAIDMGDIENIAWVMDRIMNIDDGSLHLAQTLNSSNVLLDSVKSLIEMLARKRFLNGRSFSKNDYQLAVQDQFVIQISYPLYNNVTGLALYKKGLSDKFTDMKIQPLFKNMTLNDITWENLEIATWLPDQVLKSLTRIKMNNDEDSIDSDDMYIIINVYHNDAVFQELIRNDKHYINSRIIEISVPGFISNLEYPVPLLFKDINTTTSTNFCGFWNFQTSKVGNIPGSWAKQGCFTTKSFKNVTLCDCYHLTHFGNLISIEKFTSDDNTNTINNQHAEILNIITVAGSFLSLVGIIGIWITAISFQTWRKKASTKVLLQLSTSIALPLILMIIFNLDNRIFTIYNGKHVIVTHMRSLCVVLGALLHYSILANFMWMLITATLQFVRYVRVLGVARPSRFMIKFTILGWGVPFIPVTITLLKNYENYIPNPSINHPICYPNGVYFIFGVVVPICIILCVNAILFVMVIRAIAQCPDMRITDKTLIWAQLRLSILLFFLLGLTWLFGIFSFTSYIIWSYFFCLTSTVQGFVLFIYFVICDPYTRNLWVTIVKHEISSNSSRKSAVSISSG